jgi:flagellar basal body-associated protein FliL
MEPEQKSNGSLIGLVVIVIILIIGGIYIWQSNKNSVEKIKSSQTPTESVVNEDSSELNTLELDANTTDIDVSIDANTIE